MRSVRTSPSVMSFMTPGMVSGLGNGRNQAAREGATFGATVPAFKRVWRVRRGFNKVPELPI